MNRREFLKQSSLASSLVFVPNFISACEDLFLKELSSKKLVIIQLAGGNDGLNTIVPYKNDIYYKSRPNIALKEDQVIPLEKDLGFNSNLKGLMNIYNKGYLTIVNDVGYPNPNRSHFRSTDIWQTASDSNQYLSSGWIGRYMDQFAPETYYGIEIDDSLSPLLKGKNTSGIATKNPYLLHANMQTPYFKKLLNYQNQRL